MTTGCSSIGTEVPVGVKLVQCLGEKKKVYNTIPIVAKNIIIYSFTNALLFSSCQQWLLNICSNGNYPSVIKVERARDSLSMNTTMFSTHFPLWH